MPRPRAHTIGVAVFVLCAALAAGAMAASTNFAELATSPEAAGDGPGAIAAADFDGDTDQDLVVVNNNSENLTILRNTGTGDFTEPASSPETADASPSAVAAADLDGDGDQDLAVANADSDNVTRLRNNGSGNFGEFGSSPDPVGDFPNGVVAADLDGDTDQDLAVANEFGDTATILKNNGSGNFSEPSSSPEATGDGSIALVAADVDNDTDQDLAVANAFSEDVSVLKNNGSGNFNQPNSSPDPAGGFPRSIAAADLDGDGDRDLATANLTSSNVTILRNRGTGNFVEPNSSPEAVGTNPAGVAAGDFDADGDQDLAVANNGSSDVTILKNSGSANFFEPNSSPEAAGLGAIALVPAPLDADSDQDLAVANFTGDNVTILGNQ